MDWITTWADGHFLAGMLSAIVVYWLGRNWEGWLRALRRSEPRPVLDSHRGPLGNTGTDNPCPLCNPQPTSPPQSAPTTGLTSGQSARLSANLAFHLRKQAQPESED